MKQVGLAGSLTRMGYLGDVESEVGDGGEV